MVLLKGLPEISCGCVVCTDCISGGARDSAAAAAEAAAGCCGCSFEPLLLLPAGVQHQALHQDGSEFVSRTQL
jgi:hypothetical protein